MSESPFCFYCGRKLIFEYIRGGGSIPEDFPTIEHMYSKFWGIRPKQGKVVLACRICNEERSNNDRRNNPIRHRWKCAGFPFWLAPLNWYLRWKRGKKPIFKKEDFELKRWKLTVD